MSTIRALPVVSFAFRSGLGIASPPTKPPPKATFGSYCFKATCEVTDGQGCPIGKVTGYDTNPEIGKHTETACRAHVRTLRGRRQCGDASVVMLPSVTGDMTCNGEMFFDMGGTTKRLV